MDLRSRKNQESIRVRADLEGDAESQPESEGRQVALTARGHADGCKWEAPICVTGPAPSHTSTDTGSG